jgi:tRNA 2-thiouridine synthesizing protein C
MNKSILLIFRHPPFANNSNKEALDIALGCSAFDIPVSLLFLNDSILQLIKDQRGEDINQKNLLKTFSALEMYDINDHYVIDTDMLRYNLTAQDLALNCKVILTTQQALIIRQFDTVINL